MRYNAHTYYAINKNKTKQKQLISQCIKVIYGNKLKRLNYLENKITIDTINPSKATASVKAKPKIK